MLNQQVKKTIIDALMKVVDSAPTRSNYYNNTNPQYRTNTIYGQEHAVQYGISNEIFQAWINYVFSVLNITAQHVDSNLSYSVYTQIQNIVCLNSVDNASKTIDVCRIILDYAHKIVEM